MGPQQRRPPARQPQHGWPPAPRSPPLPAPPPGMPVVLTPPRLLSPSPASESAWMPASRAPPQRRHGTPARAALDAATSGVAGCAPAAGFLLRRHGDSSSLDTAAAAAAPEPLPSTTASSPTAPSHLVARRTAARPTRSSLGAHRSRILNEKPAIVAPCLSDVPGVPSLPQRLSLAAIAISTHAGKERVPRYEVKCSEEHITVCSLDE